MAQMNLYATTFTILLFIFSSPSFADGQLPKTLSCSSAKDPSYCEKQKVNFTAAWPKANSGDYMSQRTVSFCLRSGCSGSVQIDFKAACSWETVISGSAMGDASDASNFREACRRTGAIDRGDAETQGRTLYGRIYKKVISRKLPYVPS